MLGIFKIALSLSDQHVFICQSVKILKIFNTFLKVFNRFSEKRKPFSIKLEHLFLVESTKLKAHHFRIKRPYQKPLLKQIEWWVQNGPITKNRAFPVTNLFFWKFCFNWRTFYKELILCTNNPNAHIRAFCKRWSFI